MSRSGYSDDCEGIGLWRGAVASAIKGRRGQKLLRELAAALDAMPEKRLIAGELQAPSGEFCTLGVLGHARGIDMETMDPYDRQGVAELFDIAPAMAAEIVFENDEVNDGWEWKEVEICGPMRDFSPFWDRRTRYARLDIPNAAEARWTAMRKWVADRLVKEA